MITASEPRTAIPELIHHTDDLMTGHHPWSSGWQVPLGQMQIGTADAAGQDANPHLADAWMRIGQLNLPKRSAGHRSGRVDNPGSHQGATPPPKQ